jgi:putative cofactor-binding repeat protein
MGRWCLLGAFVVAALGAMLIWACRSSPPPVAGTRAHAGATDAAVRVTPAGAISAVDFGARGDGATDDREALQAAIRASAARHRPLYLPPGTYEVSGVPGRHACLEIPGGVHLRGAGGGQTVIRQAAGAGRSERLLHASGDGIVIEDLTLDGNHAAQSKDEQRHGLFATRTDHLVVRRVTAQHFTGDGFYLHDGANDSLFVDDVATANDRNGITLGGMVDRTTLLDSKFVANHAQQVDSEPGGTAVVSHTTINRCEIDVGGASNDYALTVSGTPRAKGNGWTILGNQIRGGIFVVWAEHVVIAGNTVVDPTTKPGITVYRTSSDVAIIGNRVAVTQTRARSIAGVLVQGTGTGSAPDRVLVLGNEISVDYESSFGVRAEGALSVSVIGNRLRGAGRAAPGYAGIYVRATNQAEDFQRAVVSGNTVRNFGARGISLAGNGAARLLSVEIRDNTFDDDSSVPSMTAGVSLDDGTGAARRITITGNRCLHGVTTPLVNPPADPQVMTGEPPRLERPDAAAAPAPAERP